MLSLKISDNKNKEYLYNIVYIIYFLLSFECLFKNFFNKLIINLLDCCLLNILHENTWPGNL